MKSVCFSSLGANVRGILQETCQASPKHQRRPALVICPGGGYEHLSPREMDAPALSFLSLGYQVFILEYSVREEAGNKKPLCQLAQTVAMLREKAQEWEIHPDQIAVMGFSAGGHLAASLGAFWKDPALGERLALDSPQVCRPNALVLCYPVISTGEWGHEESARWVSGGDPFLREKFSIETQVTEDFPPTFLWHGGEDQSVPPENSFLLAWELRKKKVPLEFHLFGTGSHGISVCTEEVGTPDPVCRAWVSLCQTWLNQRFTYTP